MNRIIFVFGYRIDDAMFYINEQRRWYKAYDIPEFKVLHEPHQLKGFRNVEIISLVPPKDIPYWLSFESKVRDCPLSFAGIGGPKPKNKLLLLCDL